MVQHKRGLYLGTAEAAAGRPQATGTQTAEPAGAQRRAAAARAQPGAGPLRKRDVPVCSGFRGLFSVFRVWGCRGLRFRGSEGAHAVEVPRGLAVFRFLGI